MPDFDLFFSNDKREFLLSLIRLALDEDGRDLTSEGLFSPDCTLNARIVSKGDSVLSGLPILPLVLETLAPNGEWSIQTDYSDGDRIAPGETAARICGQASMLLKAERVMLNFLCHLSGIATLTAQYVTALGDSETALLDTRKTLPGMRHVEKWAVLCGGGQNHRLDLEEMLMLKDTHIDRAGSISDAVKSLRAAYSPCPPIEVECRNFQELNEAISVKADRVMLDNMSMDAMREAVKVVPNGIETEISGGVSLDNIAELGTIGVDYISVGRLTHSAPYADFSMKTEGELICPMQK